MDHSQCSTIKITISPRKWEEMSKHCFKDDIMFILTDYQEKIKSKWLKISPYIRGNSLHQQSRKNSIVAIKGKKETPIYCWWISCLDQPLISQKMRKKFKKIRIKLLYNPEISFLRISQSTKPMIPKDLCTVLFIIASLFAVLFMKAKN